MTNEAKIEARAKKKAPGYVTTSAALTALMVTTGVALMAVLPVAAMTIATWADPRVRALRWWASLTAALYAIPFAQYLLRADREASMAHMLNPYMGGAIAIAELIVLLKILKSH